MKDETRGEKVDVSREAIAALAAEAAGGVEGVQVCHQKAVDTLTSRVKREFVHKGVKVEKEDSAYRLTLYLRASYGASLPSIADEVRKKVKDYVEGLTEVEIEDVEVIIEDLDF